MGSISTLGFSFSIGLVSSIFGAEDFGASTLGSSTF